jgi:hypothetical protein
MNWDANPNPRFHCLFIEDLAAFRHVSNGLAKAIILRLALPNHIADLTGNRVQFLVAERFVILRPSTAYLSRQREFVFVDASHT